MNITRNSRVSDVATGIPATIKIFQEFEIEFCCGGKRPLAEACAERGIDVDALVAKLQAAASATGGEQNWQTMPLHELVAYIQQRFHEPLRDELPRLAAMMARVVSRHGDHLPETLRPLQDELTRLQEDLMEHTAREDATLFPAIVAAETRGTGGDQGIERSITALEAEHDQTGRALARIRQVTGDYTPPEWACPTFRGLYYGLSELEREMHLHVHLENNVLFPRAISTAAVR